MHVCLSACLCHLFVCVYLFVCSRRHSQRRTILVIQPWPTRRQKPESTQWSHLICHCSHPLNAMLPGSFLFSQWSQWFSQWPQWFSQCHAMLGYNVAWELSVFIICPALVSKCLTTRGRLTSFDIFLCLLKYKYKHRHRLNVTRYNFFSLIILTSLAIITR